MYFRWELHRRYVLLALAAAMAVAILGLAHVALGQAESRPTSTEPRSSLAAVIVTRDGKRSEVNDLTFRFNSNWLSTNRERFGPDFSEGDGNCIAIYTPDHPDTGNMVLIELRNLIALVVVERSDNGAHFKHKTTYVWQGKIHLVTGILSSGQFLGSGSFQAYEYEVRSLKMASPPINSGYEGAPSFSFWKMLGTFVLGLLIFFVLELIYNFLMGAIGLWHKSFETWRGWKVIGYAGGVILLVGPDSPWGGGIFSWHIAHTVAFLVGAGIATLCLLAARQTKRNAEPGDPPTPSANG